MKIKKLLSALLLVTIILPIFSVPSYAKNPVTFNLFQLLGYETEEYKKANTAVLSDCVEVEKGGLSGGEVIAFVVEPGTTLTFNREIGCIIIDDVSLKTDYSVVYSSYKGIKSDIVTVTGETVKTTSFDGVEYEYFKPGATVTFNKTGDRYRVYAYDNDPRGPRNNLWLDTEQWMVTFNVKNPTAKYTNAKVSVNGKPTEFEAYVLNGNNYFKLRDLAYVLSGTAKQFDVGWDSENKVIEMMLNKPYTKAGGELKKGDGKDKTATPYTNGLNFDSMIVPASAYTINSNNYFKLRDICKMLDIGVTWDNNSKTIGIDTSIGYTE